MHLFRFAVGFFLIVLSSSNGVALSLDEIPNKIIVPRVPQTKDYTCGAAALTSIFRFFGFSHWTEALAEKDLGTVPEFGTHHKDILRVSSREGLMPRGLQNQTLDDLKRSIDRGRPVIAAYQYEHSEPPKPWDQEWEQGHYAVVMGYTAEDLVIMDPMSPDQYVFIPAIEFLQRWHDDDGDVRLVQFAIYFDFDKPFEFYNYKALKRG